MESDFKEAALGREGARDLSTCAPELEVRGSRWTNALSPCYCTTTNADRLSHANEVVLGSPQLSFFPGVGEILMKQIHKEYERPFLLEKTKLDRIMDVIHERFGERERTLKRDDFQVFLSGQRREEITHLDDLLKLDNSRKSKIQRLLVTCYAGTEGATVPDHKVQVDFDARPIAKSQTKVVISVRSDDVSWASRVLSEVEEQVERTFLQDFAQRAALVLIVGGAAFFLLLMVASSLGGRLGIDFAGDMWLHSTDLDRVEQILKPGHTISELEMREVNTMQLRNLLDGKRPKGFSSWSRQKKLVIWPLLFLLGCGGYLRAACYPSAVFLWGDEKERYDKILHTRRILWSLIYGSIGVGVLSKLAYAAMVPGP